MSQKYDEYVNTHSPIDSFHYDPDRVIPMLPQPVDPDLLRELRDRAMIELITDLVHKGVSFTYGDIIACIDDDLSEKEYEESKKHTR